MAIILVHCTSTTAGVIEYFRDMVDSWYIYTSIPKNFEYIVDELALGEWTYDAGSLGLFDYT